MVTYEKLLMRCKAWHSWKHRIEECKEIQRRPVRGRRRATHAPHALQNEKGKYTEVDEDGFQQVKYRTNAGRKIFDIVDDDMRKSAHALADEARAARYRAKQQGAETSRGLGRQEKNTTNVANTQQQKGQPGSGRIVGPEVNQAKIGATAEADVAEGQFNNSNSGKMVDSTTECMAVVEPTTMEVDPNHSKSGAKGTCDTNGDAVDPLETAELRKTHSPTRSQGDLTSMMLWSRRKHAG